MVLVGVLIVAVVFIVYRYLYPTQPWLEGFQDSKTPILIDDAVKSLVFLNNAYNHVNKTNDDIINDMLKISACPKSYTQTNISKACYGGLLNKYGIDPEVNLSEKSDINLATVDVLKTLNVFRDYNDVFGHIDDLEFTAMLRSTSDCKTNTIGRPFIGPKCYNILLKTYLKTAGTAPDSDSVAPAEDTASSADPVATATSSKDYRVSFFKNLSLIAGYTNLKTDAIETAYDKMTSCGKDDSEYDH